jgi:hypothetical protein
MSFSALENGISTEKKSSPLWKMEIQRETGDFRSGK